MLVSSFTRCLLATKGIRASRQSKQSFSPVIDSVPFIDAFPTIELKQIEFHFDGIASIYIDRYNVAALEAVGKIANIGAVFADAIQFPRFLFRMVRVSLFC